MRIYRLGAFIAVIASTLALQGCYDPPRPDGWQQRCTLGNHFDDRASRCLPDLRGYNHPDGHWDRDRDRRWDNNHDANWNREHGNIYDPNWHGDRDDDHTHYHNGQ